LKIFRKKCFQTFINLVYDHSYFISAADVFLLFRYSCANFESELDQILTFEVHRMYFNFENFSS
jgi:hypothetical protein